MTCKYVQIRASTVRALRASPEITRFGRQTRERLIPIPTAVLLAHQHGGTTTEAGRGLKRRCGTAPGREALGACGEYAREHTGDDADAHFACFKN
jgi:hypothetical protein